MTPQEQYLKQLQDQYGGYGIGNAADRASQMSTLGGASTFVNSLANGNIAGFGDDQKRQALQQAEIARQYGLGVQNPTMSQDWQDAEARRNPTQYDPNQLATVRRQMDMAGGMNNFFGNTANSTQEQLNLQNQLQGATEDPFAGQNMNDASVQFQMQQYMQRNPNYVPVNTYKGEAPRLPGDINQDTGIRTMEGVSGQNPYAGNKGFLQTNMMGGGQPQINPQAQAPQQNRYLQPFQQTNAYQSAMSNNYGMPSQSTQQPNNYMQPAQQSSFSQPAQSFNNQPTQQPTQAWSPYGGAQPQSQGLLQQNSGFSQQTGTSQSPQNRYGLLSAYGSR